MNSINYIIVILIYIITIFISRYLDVKRDHAIYWSRVNHNVLLWFIPIINILIVGLKYLHDFLHLVILKLRKMRFFDKYITRYKKIMLLYDILKHINPTKKKMIKYRKK